MYRMTSDGVSLQRSSVREVPLDYVLIHGHGMVVISIIIDISRQDTTIQ
jgi:hypothetical protein